MTASTDPPTTTDPTAPPWLVEYFTDQIAKGYDLWAAEIAIFSAMGDAPDWTPSDRIELHDAFGYGAEAATWKGQLLNALIVHMAAGMVMTLPAQPDDEFIVDYLSGLCEIPNVDPEQVGALHDAARSRVDGERRAFENPGRWLSTAAALAGFWILEPEGGPEKYQGRALTTDEAIERARPVVDFFYSRMFTPEAFGWLFPVEFDAS